MASSLGRSPGELEAGRRILYNGKGNSKHLPGLAPGQREGKAEPLKSYAVTAVLGACAMGAVLAGAVESPAPSALALARNLRGTSMGVDRSGDLWTWDGPPGRVALYSPAGALLSSASIPGALALDLDRDWGVAAISRSGFELRLRAWTGGAERVIPLSERASAVAWVGPDSVALGMATAGHRVEIWNVRDKLLAKTFGTEVPVTRRPGLSRMRAYQMQYAPAKDQLITLESFSGDLQVFSMDGRLVRRDQVPAGADRTSIEAWLNKLDEKGRATGEVKDPLITWYRLALDAAGNAWIVQSCQPNGGATLLQFPATGAVKEVAFDVPCCSRAFVIWGAHAIFYREPADPLPTCNGVRSLP